MNHTANSAQAQQRLIRSQQAGHDCQSIFNLLTGDVLFNEVEAHLPEHRDTQTGGYCRPRQRLPIGMVSGLARCVGQ